MKERLVLDTGPLVAFLDRREAIHPWVVDTFKQSQTPFLTCEAVVTEACFLLRRTPKGMGQIAEWLGIGFIDIPFHLEDASERVFSLMEKYRDQPMSLAEACLVAMVEQGIGDRVLTLDRHFRVYRHSGRRVVPVLMPE